MKPVLPWFSKAWTRPAAWSIVRVMKLLSRVLLFTALVFVSPSQGQEAGAGSPAQVTLRFDWVSLPHADADRLIRQQLQSVQDAAALRKSVDELIAAGKATLLDINTLVVRSGQRAKIETIHEKPYPTEFALASQPAKLEQMKAAGALAVLNPAAPSCFVVRNLLPQFTTFTGRDSFGQGTATTLQPRFHTMKMTGTLLLRAGQTALFGTADPCPVPEAAPRTGAGPPPPPGRKVVLFVRATL